MVKNCLVLLVVVIGASAVQFSVSGISSGAFQAVQMHVAYSSQVVGAGIIAGGPYHCSRGSLLSTNYCMSMPYLLSLKHCEQYTRDQATAGTIDPISNLANTSAWVYSGLIDTVVNQLVGRDLAKYYEVFGVKVSTKFDMPSEHAWITQDYGNACALLMSPYMNHCKYDAAGELLKVIYGDGLVSKAQVKDNLKTFDQSQYADSGAGMDSEGYVYVPTGCASNPSACRVHISYHGCAMGKEVIGDQFAANSGLNEWGEGSNIIIVYPQIKKNLLKNPNGCWDWWGYTGSDFALKSGAQMAATQKMAANPPVK